MDRLFHDVPVFTSRFAVLLLAVCGCDGGEPDRLVQADLEPRETAQRAIKRYDLNGDGKISGPELSPALRAILATADKDNDQALSETEIAQRLEIQAESKIALQTVSGPVLWKKRPLVGATVTLIPDAIFTNLKTASGVTDENGYVDFQIKGEDLSGVRPGFYRIEVSKKVNGKEIIPAKYNVQTQLGIEIGEQESADRAVASASFELNLR